MVSKKGSLNPQRLPITTPSYHNNSSSMQIRFFFFSENSLPMIKFNHTEPVIRSKIKKQGQNKVTPLNLSFPGKKKGLPDFSESPIKSSFLLITQ